MALGNVIIKDVDGNLPYAASASNEKITGLLFDVSGQPDLFTAGYGKSNEMNVAPGDVICITSRKSSVQDFGIQERVACDPDEEANENFLFGIPAYHIREFFRMGGNLSLIGAPGNLIAQSALGEIGMSFGFFEYAIVGLPILAVGILFYATLGMKLLPNHPVSDDDSFSGEQNFSNVPKWKQVLSLVILVLTLLGMIFKKQIGIKLNITGCIGALTLILTGAISEKDALKSIDLKTIFLFGGTLSLASALDKTGAGAEIANIVIGALGESPSPYVLTLVVFLLCCVMTNFMSNTATTALMVPICLSIAQGMGADPRAVLMACVIGGSCAYATPIGMPANTMVVSAGGYTFKDYAKAGLPLILIATVVSMVILPIAFPFFPQ